MWHMLATHISTGTAMLCPMLVVHYAFVFASRAMLDHDYSVTTTSVLGAGAGVEDWSLKIYIPSA